MPQFSLHKYRINREINKTNCKSCQTNELHYLEAICCHLFESSPSPNLFSIYLLIIVKICGEPVQLCLMHDFTSVL